MHTGPHLPDIPTGSSPHASGGRTPSCPLSVASPSCRRRRRRRLTSRRSSRARARALARLARLAASGPAPRSRTAPIRERHRGAAAAHTLVVVAPDAAHVVISHRRPLRLASRRRCRRHAHLRRHNHRPRHRRRARRCPRRRRSPLSSHRRRHVPVCLARRAALPPRLAPPVVTAAVAAIRTAIVATVCPASPWPRRHASPGCHRRCRRRRRRRCRHRCRCHRRHCAPHSPYGHASPRLVAPVASPQLVTKGRRRRRRTSSSSSSHEREVSMLACYLHCARVN